MPGIDPGSAADQVSALLYMFSGHLNGFLNPSSMSQFQLLKTLFILSNETFIYVNFSSPISILRSAKKETFQLCCFISSLISVFSLSSSFHPP